jgi:hypothetical protein
MALARASFGIPNSHEAYFNTLREKAAAHLLPKLLERSTSLSAITPADPAQELTIFYPGCGVMPGLPVLISGLVAATGANNFHVTALDTGDYFYDIATLYQKYCNEPGIDQLTLSFSTGVEAPDELIIRRTGFASLRNPVKVRLEYIRESLLDFLIDSRGAKFDCIFIEHPTVEASAIFYDVFCDSRARPVAGYRCALTLLFSVSKPNTQVITVCHTGLELAQTNTLLHRSFPRGSFTQHRLLSVYPSNASVYKNLIMGEAGAVPESAADHDKMFKSNQSMMHKADFLVVICLALSMVLFLTGPSPYDLTEKNGWLGMALFLGMASHSLFHKVEKNGLAIHAGLLAAQVLCWSLASTKALEALQENLP